MAGLEIVVGLFIAWASRKVRRVGEKFDKFVDDTVDDGFDQVAELVMQKLKGDSAITQLRIEAEETGQVAERTRSRVLLALEEATERDLEFANALNAALETRRTMVDSGGNGGINIKGGVRASGSGVAIGGVTGGVVNLGDTRNP